MIKLEFLNDDYDPMWVVSKSFSIGSADENNLVLNDASVGLQHAKIIYHNSSFHLKDLNSQFGTYVNDQKINQVTLKHGDIIRLGDVCVNVVDPNKSGNITQWSLVACSSWLTGQEFPLRSKKGSLVLKIGRSNHCDIIFPGTHLSREHLEVRLEKDHLKVKDLKSANGTFLNNNKISESTVKAGDLLRLDVYDFRVVGPQAQTAAAKPKVETPKKIKAKPNKDKTWSARPTSPGNREEQTKEPGQNIVFLGLAVVLLLGLIALGIYLFSS